MLEKIWEFLFPSNSNAKNRITIFLWFLACFIFAMVFTFWNGYYLGKCNYSGTNSVSACDTTRYKKLEIENQRLKDDSALIRVDIHLLVRKLDYQKLKNSYDPLELNEYSSNLTQNTILKDSALRIIKSVSADIINYKSMIISNNDDTIKARKEEIESLKEDVKAKKKEYKDWEETAKKKRE